MQTLRYLAIVISLFAASVLAQTSAPPASTSLPFALKPLGHNAWAAIDDAKGDAGANAGFVIGDDGVAVIDTFEHPEAAQQLLVEIRKLTALPVKFVVNTHYHIDHVAGNRVFQQAGAIVFAQRNVRTWIHTENLKFFGKDIKAEEKTMVESLGSPDAVYDSGVTLFLGSRKIEVRVFPGHTGGDSVVFVPDANIVFTGDLVLAQNTPQPDRCDHRRLDLHSRFHRGGIHVRHDIRSRTRRCRHPSRCTGISRLSGVSAGSKSLVQSKTAKQATRLWPRFSPL